MKYGERVLAFIDILGFSEKIKNTVDKVTGEEIASEIVIKVDYDL
jgi:hypothetical protein